MTTSVSLTGALRRKASAALLAASMGLLSAAGATVGVGAIGVTPAHAQQPGLAQLEAAAKASPRDAAAQTALGRAYLRRGQHKKAEKVLKRAKKLSKGDSTAVMRLAEVWIDGGNYKKARNTCRSLLLKHKQKDPVARLCLAKAYLAWNRSSKAFEELELVRAEAPDLVEAQLVLGDAHSLRSQVAEAEAGYAAAKASPDLVAAAELGLGRLYMGVSRTADAKKAFERARAADPEWPEVQYELGRVLGGGPEAIALLGAAFAGRPDWPGPAVALGDAHFAAGEHAKAADYYRKAIALDDKLHTSHRGLGRSLLALGKIEPAEAALRAGLALFANDPVATLALGEVLVQQGRTEEALEELRHAADLEPTNPLGLVRCAEVCVGQKRYTLAAGYLDRLLDAHPDSAAGLALYGDVMVAHKERDKAREYYQSALKGKGPLDRARVEKILKSL